MSPAPWAGAIRKDQVARSRHTARPLPSWKPGATAKSQPNRVAALGMNVVLLVNLPWSAVLYLRFSRGDGSFARLDMWQTGYLPVYAGWAAVVVLVFPVVFRFI